MILLTGGAGFIGTNVLRELNQSGIEDILVVDNIGCTEKWQNMVGCRFINYFHKDDIWLEIEKYKNELQAIVHLGACSSTTEQDFDYLIGNNVFYSQKLWSICIECQIPFVYASSAATYGDGSAGFSDRHDHLDFLKPLSRYGLSKHLFDRWVLKQGETPPIWVGLKYFNVYGPYEAHKGRMASMVFHGYKQIISTGQIRLFASHKEHYQDGDQTRDFVYSKDVAKFTLLPLEKKVESGIYNVGTGRGRTFNDLALALFKSMKEKVHVEYIPMPDDLKDKYQYFTQADATKIKNSSYSSLFSVTKSIEEGVESYVECLKNH